MNLLNSKNIKIIVIFILCILAFFGGMYYCNKNKKETFTGTFGNIDNVYDLQSANEYLDSDRVGQGLCTSEEEPYPSISQSNNKYSIKYNINDCEPVCSNYKNCTGYTKYTGTGDTPECHTFLNDNYTRYVLDEDYNDIDGSDGITNNQTCYKSSMLSPGINELQQPIPAPDFPKNNAIENKDKCMYYIPGCGEEETLDNNWYIGEEQTIGVNECAKIAKEKWDGMCYPNGIGTTPYAYLPIEHTHFQPIALKGKKKTPPLSPPPPPKPPTPPKPPIPPPPPPEKCAADYNTNYASDGTGGTVGKEYVCTKEFPYCINYEYNKNWGTCSNTKSPKKTNPILAGNWETPLGAAKVTQNPNGTLAAVGINFKLNVTGKINVGNSLTSKWIFGNNLPLSATYNPEKNEISWSNGAVWTKYPDTKSGQCVPNYPALAAAGNSDWLVVSDSDCKNIKTKAECGPLGFCPACCTWLEPTI